MKIIESNYKVINPERTLVCFDAEWTKNYKIKNGNKPFCYSIVLIDKPAKKQKIRNNYSIIGFKSVYAENTNEITEVSDNANQDLGYYLDKHTTIIGHQLFSDLSVIINSSNKKLNNLETIYTAWKDRKNNNNSNKTMAVFDTRFDITLPDCESRRLVDVCNAMNLNVFQPELTLSMTKMQNEFYKTQDINIREKISVLNIRHSLSAGLVYLKNQNCIAWNKTYNVNNIIMNSLYQSFDYIKHPSFRKLCS